jgi:citrate synthase
MMKPLARTVTAEEAARLLGVTRRTLYAYVSRGLIRSEPGPGPSRARSYPRDQIDALMRSRSGSPQQRAARGAMSWGLPVVESSLTLIAGGRLSYRGRDAIELSRRASLEDVASMLWSQDDGRAPVVFPPGRRTAARVDVSPTERMARWLVSRAAGGATTAGGPHEPLVRHAARLVAGLFAAAGAPGGGPVAERLAAGWDTGRREVVSAALVLCADHELNVSAFTARCVASADARLDRVLLAALCAFEGRRHGGAASRIASMIGDARRGGAAAAVTRALDDQGEVPGFGHPLYPLGDPRAAELLRRCPAPRRGDVLREIEEHCSGGLGLRPNVDFALAAVEHRLGLPPSSGSAIFALGRSVGWVAHAIETWRDGALIRPRSRYVGPAPGSPPPR